MKSFVIWVGDCAAFLLPFIPLSSGNYINKIFLFVRVSENCQKVFLYTGYQFGGVIKNLFWWGEGLCIAVTWRLCSSHLPYTKQIT